MYPNLPLYLELISFGFVCIYAFKYFYREYRYYLNEQIGKQHRIQRDSRTYTFPEVSQDKESKILEAKDLSTLRSLQITGEVTSVDLVSFYSKRCSTIGRQLNLITEEFYEEALEMAREKDAETQRAKETGKTD